jgi:hypothetical protein
LGKRQALVKEGMDLKHKEKFEEKFATPGR